MKKILLSLLAFGLISLNANAKPTLKNELETIIEDSGVNIESIAVSFKDVNNSKLVYALNDKILMNPASVQKILTTPVIAETLGENYEFKTELYTRGDKDFVIKLSADPYLSSKDLKELITPINIGTNRVFIDDSIIDNKIWGEGWQWDDDMNILMPRFNSYNLDKNLIKLTILPNDNDEFATIINPSKYPLVFFNNIKKGENTDINIHRDSSISTNTMVLTGTVARPTIVYIPTSNLKRYFDVQLKQILENKKVYLKDNFSPTQIVETDYLVNTVSHNIDKAIDDILKNSNNLTSETLFKLAGKKYCGIKTGTDVSGIKMFNDYCSKNNLDSSKIRITDSSGVSKNNLVSADFVSEFLLVNKDNKIYEKLPKPSEGTLTHRMLPLKDNLKAKTGTLSDISTIAGFLTTKKGKKLAFCIMINDIKLSPSDKKMLEDFIIREAYLKL